MKNIVVIGAGFAGLTFVKEICKRKDIDFNIKLIDRRNHHLFQPLLYQVATAGLNPADIAVPIRSEFKNNPRVEVILGAVKAINTQQKNVVLESNELISYDELVVATGAEHSYFAHPEWEQFAPGLKTLEQATEIRRRILTAFEAAETSPSELQSEFMTFAVVGGGPTGVEMAGAIAEIAKQILESDFRHLKPQLLKVYLIEAGERILASFDKSLSDQAEKDLTKLGVDVLTQTKVTDLNEDFVATDKLKIKCRTKVWAAGVKPSELARLLGSDLDRQGRVIVDRQLRAIKDHSIYVLGDLAHCEHKGQPLPGLAPVAIQQGKFLAQHLYNFEDAEFSYFDKGQMATIGKRKAVMQFKTLKWKGWWAWMAWLTIHIYYLVGFKNKFFVFWQWIYSYVAAKRGSRLILNRTWQLNSKRLMNS